MTCDIENEMNGLNGNDGMDGWMAAGFIYVATGFQGYEDFIARGFVCTYVRMSC